MSFVEKYTSQQISEDVGNHDTFLALEMRTELYEFLWDHGAFPNETQKMEVYDRIVFHPWKNDIFTAYKTILYGMILSKLYPEKEVGHSKLFLDESYAIHEMYKAHKLTEPLEEQQAAIRAELHRIADGYAKAVIQGHIEINDREKAVRAERGV